MSAAAPRDDLLDGLPDVFSYSEARRRGVPERTLYSLRDSGEITQLGRGLYRRAAAEPADVNLLEIAYRAADATLCLATALARHGLTDLIPPTIDVAVPRGSRRPRTSAPVTWHSFDPGTFAVGRTTLSIAAKVEIGLYEAERSIVDAYRLRHREGSELATTALRRWLSRPGSEPSSLLRTARHFPAAEPALRHAMEILL